MKDGKRMYKKSIILTIFVFLFVAFVASFSYAFYLYSAEGVVDNKIETCSLDMEFTDKDSINLVAGYPIDDEEVDNYAPYIVTINNNSECEKIYYYLNMTNYCDFCEKEGNTCYFGENEVNCSEDYLIDPQYIKYKVTNVDTGKTVIGYNPEVMYLENIFDGKGKNTFEIRLWISNKATNKDLYVYDEVGNILEDIDGKYITRKYLSRLDTEVSFSEDEKNVAVVIEDVFNKQEDGSYSNKYQLSEYRFSEINILKYVWKENTRYQFSFSSKCPAAVKNLYLVAFYTDKTTGNVASVSCNDDFVNSSVLESTVGKTIDKVGLTYYGNSGIDTVFVKDFVVKEMGL